MATALSSFEEARQVLKSQGIRLDVKTIRSITLELAERARVSQKAELVDLPEDLSGRATVISADGGRTRTRQKRRGKKTAKGRNRYKGEWREPKLLLIYTVTTTGRQDKTFIPILDGTLKGPDAVFSLLKYYLGQLKVTKADWVLLVADGAPWIWNRVPSLVKCLGIAADRVYEVIDFYHAVEHLGTVANHCKKWRLQERRHWIGRQRKNLRDGKIDTVIADIRALCRGGSKIRKELNYFVKNRHRMQNYAQLRQIGLPIGSGPMESAIRRAINQKLKGAGIFWLTGTLEKLLMLRCYYKAGRWDQLKKLAFTSPLLSAA